MKNILTICILAAIAIVHKVPLAKCQAVAPVTPERIAVTARPSGDSVLLRWAPLDFQIWKSGNSHGYRIERYVVLRNGALLPTPEKVILAPTLKPLPEEAWETLVVNDRYAAIAAQALYGDRFEIDLKQSDVFTIVNKVRENEQRFAFALFSADMSPAVARASGLWFTDKGVQHGEKYLYRVVVNTVDSLRGSIFISPQDDHRLPEPQNLKAEFKDRQVTLKWDKNQSVNYTAYIVERSEDGQTFRAISDIPIVTISPTALEDSRFEYAVDSLSDVSKIYSYRVRGMTPFGERSPASRVVRGKAILSVTQVPFITSAVNVKNVSILLQWEFPSENNPAIDGFSIERAGEPKGNFLAMSDRLLPAGSREYNDHAPLQVNYYRVVAKGRDGENYSSHLYFAQLVDSLPPAPPADVKAVVTDSGSVKLSWRANSEQDIFGYRIYKAYHKTTELTQVTTAPIPESSFTDQVNLNALNENVYYRIMALDVNQNHSALSEMLKVSLPDKVKPQPPVFLPVSSSNRGVALGWIPSASDDVIQYKVYRRSGATGHWQLLEDLPSSNDTAYYYFDESAQAGERNYYTVLSIDDAGLESDPAHPVAGIKIANALQPAVTWKKPRVDREENRITLQWMHANSNIASFQIFRSVDGQPPVLLTSIPGSETTLADRLIPGQRYSYRILALFANGQQSRLSEIIEYQY